MMSLETVRSYPTPEPTPQINIEFSPHGSSFTYNVGEKAYSPANAFYAKIGVAITFEATVTFARSTRYAVSYVWEFGDGGKAYNNPATHTYLYANPLQVTLIVTDNFGEEWKAYKVMYPEVGKGLAEATITDTLKHGTQPGSFTALPWAENAGTFTEEGWGASSFVESYYELKGNSHNGVYWNTEKIQGGAGYTILQTNGATSSLKRSFGTWLFSAAGSEPSGYQAIAINESVALTYRLVLRKWIGGVVTTFGETTGLTIEENGAIAVQAKAGLISAWMRKNGSAEWLLTGSEHSDATFTEGYSGYDGNGSNPLFLNFSTGKL